MSFEFFFNFALDNLLGSRLCNLLKLLMDDENVVLVDPGRAHGTLALFSWLHDGPTSAAVADAVSAVLECFPVNLWVLNCPIRYHFFYCNLPVDCSPYNFHIEPLLSAALETNFYPNYDF